MDFDIKNNRKFFPDGIFQKEKFSAPEVFSIFSGHFLLFMKEGMWPKMMKNVNQEGSLCLEKKYGEIKGKKVKRWILIRFFLDTFCCLWKKGSYGDSILS